RAVQCRGPRAADSAVPQRLRFGLGQRPVVAADRAAFLVSRGFADGPPAAARFAAVGEPVGLSLSQRTRPDRGTSAVAGAGGITSARSASWRTRAARRPAGRLAPTPGTKRGRSHAGRAARRFDPRAATG